MKGITGKILYSIIFILILITTLLGCNIKYNLTDELDKSLNQDKEDSTKPPATGPVMAVYDSGNREIPSGTGSYDFGTAAPAMTITKNFTIKNIGNADLEMSSYPIVAINNDPYHWFNVYIQPSCNIIQPGMQDSFQIQFHSSMPGLDASADVFIQNNYNAVYTFKIYAHTF